jgi:hypothetical protein
MLMNMETLTADLARRGWFEVGATAGGHSIWHLRPAPGNGGPSGGYTTVLVRHRCGCGGEYSPEVARGGEAARMAARPCHACRLRGAGDLDEAVDAIDMGGPGETP